MQRARILITLGLVVSLLPYLGFPYAIKNILMTCSGLGIIYFGYVLYTEMKKSVVKEKETFENFSENQDFVENNSEDTKEVS